MSRRVVAALVLFAAGFTPSALGAISEVGLPPIRVVEPAPGEASFQSFALATDPRGLLYLGNLSGLFVYDGARWNRRELPSTGSLQALAVDDAGELAVGALDEIGVFPRRSDGASRYRSLTAMVPEADRPLDDVIAIHRVESGWIFVTARAAWLAAAPAGDRLEPIARWQAAETPPQSFAALERRYLWLESGLYRLEVDGVRLVPGGERFQGRPVAGLVALGGRELAFTEADGLSPLDGGALDPAVEPLAAWAREHEVTTALALGDGRHAVGSRRGGLAIVAGNGVIERRLDTRSGLPDDFVRALARDAEGALWAALNAGLVRIDLASELTLFPADPVSPRSVLAFQRHRGELYAGASSGLYRLGSSPSGGESRLLPAEVGLRSVFALAEVGAELWVGERDGLWISRDGAFHRLAGSAGETVYVITPSSLSPDFVWLGLRRGLGAARRSGGRWRFEPPLAGSPRFVRSIVERGAKRLWLGTALSGFARADRIGPSDNESSGGWSFSQFEEGEIVFSEIDSEIVAVVERVHRLDEERAELVPDHPAAAHGADPRSFLAHQDPLGRLWVNGSILRRFDRQSDGRYSGSPRTIAGTEGRDIQAMFGEGDGVLWIATDRGVARYQERDGALPRRKPRAMLRAVSIDGSPAITESDPLPSHPLTLPQTGSRIRVDLAPGTFAGGVAFETRLDPIEKSWSSPRVEPLVELAGLPAGVYALQVRAREAGGDPGEVTTLAFEILPPWYRTSSALAVAALLAALAIGGAVRFRTRTLRRRARRLEAEVGAKTAELSTMIASLQATREDLERKNQMLAEANDRLERWSLEDELTGLANRRAVDLRLEDELARACRNGSPLAVILFDLDRFKQINDRLGHEEGDRCLERIGVFVRSQLHRRTDFAARHGGEEILLLLPNTPLGGAAAIAESLRAGIAALELGSGAGGPALTASFGVALAAGAADETARDLLRRADAALYRAKSEGRDRVVLAPH